MNPTVYGHYDTVADALHNTRPWEESGRNDQQVPSQIIGGSKQCAVRQWLERSSLQ